MSEIIQCPVCNSKLKTITVRHLNSQKHQNALKKSGIDSKTDPALNFIKKKPKKSVLTVKELKEISNRLIHLENIVDHLQKNQQKIFDALESLHKNIKSEEILEKYKQLNDKDIFRAINKCIQMNEGKSRWVKIDDVISILKLNREQDRESLNKLLIKMFNQNSIDLAEGGDPKYPLIFQNRVFGMLTIQ